MSNLQVRNDAKHLRHLLTDLYVAVLGFLPTDDSPEPLRLIPLCDWDTLMTTVLDAAEGRNFVPLTLPWPPTPLIAQQSDLVPTGGE